MIFSRYRRTNFDVTRWRMPAEFILQSLALGVASLLGIAVDYFVIQTLSSALVDLLDMSVTLFQMTHLLCIINEYL